MNSDVRLMLESMYDQISEKFKDRKSAWDRFIEFLAVDNCGILIKEINGNFDWLFSDMKFAGKLMTTYNPESLKQDHYDHLGDMYVEKFIPLNNPVRKRIIQSESEITNMLADPRINEKAKRICVLDPSAGTGRLLMAVYEKVPESILFGVDSDLNLLRIAMTNFVIHDIPGYLLNANILEHETDISKENGDYNWQFANKWYSHFDRLKPMQRIPEKTPK